MNPFAPRVVRVALVLCTPAAAALGQTHAFTAVPPKSAQETAAAPAAAVRFRGPQDVAVDRMGNVYVVETSSHTIRKVTSDGRILTFAGEVGEKGSADGIGNDARFNQPTGIAADAGGNLYVADDQTIRLISPGGVVTTLAGRAGQVGFADAKGSDARFDFDRRPLAFQGTGLALDSAGNLYVADIGNRKIRRITPDGMVTTFAQSESLFHTVDRIAFDRAGNLFVADSAIGAIHKVSPAGEVTTTTLVPLGRNPRGDWLSTTMGTLTSHAAIATYGVTTGSIFRQATSKRSRPRGNA